MSCVVVIGPRTRLGRELVARARGRGDRVLAVARPGRDAEELKATWGDDPGIEVVHAEVGADVPAGARVFVCALGPVQSGDRVDDPAVVEAELAALARLLGAKARVVLVSSVVALAPKRDRRHYGGWKNLVEDRLRVLAAENGVELSVVYPGRLVERRSGNSWRDFVHTPYPKLARVVETSSSRPPADRAVGLDARVWLLVRGARLASGALTGSGV